jgi:predicted DNA-binding protein
MHEMIAEKKTRQVNIRLAEQVYERLKTISYNEDSRVTDLIRKAIRKTYGPPKK